MMGDMSISPVAARRAAGRGRGRTGWVPATALTVTALLAVGACSAGGSSSGQGAPPAAGGTAPVNTGAGGAPQATGSAAGIVPGHSTLHWHSCAGQLAQQGVPECATLSVPVDYAKPGGRHISLSRFFTVTTAFIMLLAAGLFATGVGRLQGLGLLPLSEPVWNTSWLLSDKSVAGGFLSGLIGYRSQPTVPELCVYVGYILVMGIVLFGRRTPTGVTLADPTQP